MNAVPKLLHKPDARPIIDLNGFNELKLCRSGPMIYNRHDAFIGRSLQKYGEFSWSEMEIFKQIIKPGMTVIDAGANIGTHTVEFSKMAGFVMAFEPQRISFQTLCANLALNNCVNVRAFQVAVGRECKMISVTTLEQDKPNNFGGFILADNAKGEPVEMMMLDNFGFAGGVGFIKVDIEGMEGDFLEGAKNTISKYRPIMYLEADGAQASLAMSMLMEWKYDLYWHVAPMFNPRNFMGEEEDIFGNIGSINMLCMPRETKVQVDGMKKIESPQEQWRQS